MSNTTLDWRLRQVLAELKEEYRLNVWIDYVLHTNERNRAAPSVDTIMRETGIKGRKTATDAKAWLVAHKALIPVPYGLRVGEWEKGLGRRASLMQVTGWIEHQGMAIPVLYSNLLIGESIAGLALGVGYLDSANSSLSELSLSELSLSELSLSEPKVVNKNKDVSLEQSLSLDQSVELGILPPPDEEIYRKPVIVLWYLYRDTKAREEDARQHMPKSERRLLWELVTDDPQRIECFRTVLDNWIGLGFRIHNYSGQRDWFKQWEVAGFDAMYWSKTRRIKEPTRPIDANDVQMSEQEAEEIRRLSGGY